VSVAELHPEELFDKLVDGVLTSAERERLVGHLQACPVCRFDYGARFDFEQEARVAQQRILPNLPLQPVRAPQLPVARRRRSRVLVWGAFAAVLISGSGALAAALGERPWRALAAIFVSSAEPAPASNVVSGRPPSKAAPAARVASQAAAESCQGPDCTAGLAGPDAARASRDAALLARSETTPAAATPVVTERSRASTSHAARTESSLSAAKARPLDATAPEATPSSKSTSRSTATAKTGADVATPEASNAAKLFAEGNQARRQGQSGRAFTFYQLLQEQYPGSSEAELSRVTLATLQLNGGDASSALKGFERYLAGPSRALEAEALVGRARALQRLGRKSAETAAWREVQRRFPGSVYARQATERLTALGPP
jgi:TolA-binding protein